jgi:hypothetical protein
MESIAFDGVHRQERNKKKNAGKKKKREQPLVQFAKVFSKKNLQFGMSYCSSFSF